MTAILDNPTLRALESSVTDLKAGSAHVVGAHAERRYDDEPYVLLTLFLEDPPEGVDSWSPDETFDVREQARRRIAASGIAESVSMTFVAEHGDPDEDEASGPDG